MRHPTGALDRRHVGLGERAPAAADGIEHRLGERQRQAAPCSRRRSRAWPPRALPPASIRQAARRAAGWPRRRRRGRRAPRRLRGCRRPCRRPSRPGGRSRRRRRAPRRGLLRAGEDAHLEPASRAIAAASSGPLVARRIASVAMTSSSPTPMASAMARSGGPPRPCGGSSPAGSRPVSGSPSASRHRDFSLKRGSGARASWS